MFRTVAGLLMSAALAAPAVAQGQSMTDIPGYQPSALELELPRLEARMQAFGLAVEALEDDDSLSDAERGLRTEALWAEYGPDVAALGTASAGFGVTLAGTMVETMDFEAIIEAALSEIDSEAIEAEIAAALAEIEAGDDGDWIYLNETNLSEAELRELSAD